MTLTAPLFEVPVLSKAISGRDLILIGGGLFLLWKSVHEIHNALEGEEDDERGVAAAAGFGAVIAQIAIIDIVFSLDSVITAVGMVDELAIMVIAIVIAVGVMLVSAGPISAFVDRHPTIKVLALAFLILIGVALIGEGWDLHIPKGYIYFAMAFAVAVEMLNLRMRARMREAVHLRRHMPGKRRKPR
jgi:predicted tellurium resistance membrane protein TerC